MAKRVFEIARELNLTTKELLVKLKDMDVSVKSHMSTLDAAIEGMIRENLYGKKKNDAIEETRIKPTVIRRRRKPSRGASEPGELTAEPDGTSVSLTSEQIIPDTAAPEEEPAEMVSDTAPASAKAEEASAGMAETNAEPVAEMPAEKPAIEPVKHAVPAEKDEEAARIIKIPVEEPVEPAPPGAMDAKSPVSEATEAAPPTAEAIEAESRAPETTDEAPPPSHTESPAPEVTEAEPPASKSSTEEAPTEEAPTVAAADLEKEVLPEPETPADEMDAPEKPVEERVAKVPAKPKAKKAKKKQSKETPAKIIQLPVSPPPQPGKNTASGPGPEARGRHRPTVTKPMAVPAAGMDPVRDKKKGKRGKAAGDEAVKDKKFFKKKISFRRKEVVEGSALYTSGKRGRKGRKGGKAAKSDTGQKPLITVAKAIKRRVKIDDTIILAELAKRMGIKAADMIRTLMGLGVMATVNQTIDFETAVLVAGEFDYEVERAAFEEDTFIKEQADDPENMAARPPVVTIMGHVDHGKTSLLDVIRKTRVTATEAGGITQHIGAYNVTTDRGQIVFLDTPGHEAFTAMRARGAKVTDLVVLVVAADDGVMPQTVEAINHAKASEVPIVVAVNKIDKQNADPEKVQRQLAEIGLAPEEWGGDTIYVQVSAKQNVGIDTLLEMILLQSEMLELRANPNCLATGHVVEAKLDSGRGPVATVLVQRGTLRNGDPVVCGVHFGKIRAMLNDRGQQDSEAGPSMPVEIIGLSGVPMAGDEMVALASEKDAKQVSQHRTQKLRSQELAKNSRMSLEGLFEKMKTGEVKDLNLIIKADVDGSIEALRDSLVKLSNEEVKINVVHAATGTITESDISLAAVSNAIIIGFNVRPNTKVSDMAQEENVDLRLHNVIYDVIQEVKSAIVGMMASTFEERILGKAEVREVFHVPKVGAIAGSYVTDGKMERSQPARLLRDGVIRYDGKVSSLRRFKDDVKEVQSGYECGIGIANFNDIKVGDVIECYYMEEIRPELD